MTTTGRRWLSLAGLAFCALLSWSPAGAVDADGPLLDDIGPGWAPDQLCRVMQQSAPSPMACFEHNGDRLEITSADIAVGVDVRKLVDLSASAFSAHPPLPTPGLEAAHGFIASNAPGRTALAIVIGSARHVFTLIFTSPRPVPDTAPFLAAVARRQQDHDGGPPPAPRRLPAPRDDAALDRLLMGVPPGSGFVIVDTASLDQTFDDLRATSRNQRVIDLLDGAPTRHRVFQAGPTSFVIVSLTKQPFSQFAATALGGYRDLGGIKERRQVRLVKDAIGFRFQDPAAYGVVFRRGPYVATVAVLAPASGPGNVPALEAAVDTLAQMQASLLPAGGTAPYFFPSTTRSLLLTLLFTTAVCLLAVAWARFGALRQRRRVRQPRRDGGETTFFGDAVDVDRTAVTLRREGLLLLAGQIVAVNVVVLGVLAVLEVLELGRWIGLALIAGGLGGGVAFTSWRARTELKATAGRATPVRGLWRSLLSIAGALLAVALLVVGMAFAAVGLAGVAFGPSLSVLERSKTLGLGPDVVSLLAALGGVALLVLGGVAVHLARMWARTSVARQRRRDRRPPILYLRSFDDDALPVPAVLTARRPFLELFLARGSDPFEEAVAWELAPYGPVVAIGRPGRPMSSLGAARDRLADDEWRAGVTERMAQARAIAMVLGATDGIRWELEQVASAGNLTKTIFIFPPVTASELDDRWHFTATALSSTGIAVAPLPAAPWQVLTAIVDDRGQWHAAVADARDEATYRVALDRAMGWLPQDELVSAVATDPV